MALLRTLELLKLGEEINDELYRATTKRPRVRGLLRQSLAERAERVLNVTVAAQVLRPT